MSQFFVFPFFIHPQVIYTLYAYPVQGCLEPTVSQLTLVNKQGTLLYHCADTNRQTTIYSYRQFTVLTSPN